MEAIRYKAVQAMAAAARGSDLVAAEAMRDYRGLLAGGEPSAQFQVLHGPHRGLLATFLGTRGRYVRVRIDGGRCVFVTPAALGVSP